MTQASNASPPSVPTPAKEPIDTLVVTHHTLATADGDLTYTARTGRLVVREEETKDDIYKGFSARAEMAVTAYTLDDADPATRPVTFVFNGGPGSSSLWLHLGLLGPRVVDAGEPNDPTPPPYGLLDNPRTLLRASDLVFIDPMSTGWTRAVEGGKPKEFHDYTRDVEQVSELIRLWCTREDRWMSPKVLIGESYGTTRAVSVAELLFSQHGMQLNALVLISSVLDFGSQDFRFLRFDEACVCYLPTYAAIAHYHGLHPDKGLREVLDEAEAYQDRYRHVLAQGNRLARADRAEAVAELARLTGLTPSYIDACELRPEHWRFCTELLRDRGLTVGRIDGRVTGPLHSGIAEGMDADPSIDLLVGPYTAAVHHYLRGELGSTLEHPYSVLSSTIGKEWKYEPFMGRPVNVTDKLERVMRANPHLQVRIEYGYYDLATPYGAATDMVTHLRLPAEAFDRIEHAYFETGHMPYLGVDTRDAEADGITDFVARVTSRG